jgi:hypothetical protein
MSSGYWVGWCGSELNDVKDQMQSTHWKWQLESVGIARGSPFNWEGSESPVRELPGRSGRLDVRGIQGLPVCKQASEVVSDYSTKPCRL